MRPKRSSIGVYEPTDCNNLPIPTPTARNDVFISETEPPAELTDDIILDSSIQLKSEINVENTRLPLDHVLENSNRNSRKVTFSDETMESKSMKIPFRRRGRILECTTIHISSSPK